jgi:hypothetical protein
MMPNDVPFVAAQIGDANLIRDLIQIVFSIGVAWYLLIRTTNAIGELTVEVRLMRQQFEEARKEVQHQGSGIRQEMRAISESNRSK